MNYVRNPELLPGFIEAVELDFGKLADDFDNGSSVSFQQMFKICTEVNLLTVFHCCKARLGSKFQIQQHAILVKKIILDGAKRIWVNRNNSIIKQLAGMYMCLILYVHQPSVLKRSQKDVCRITLTADDILNVCIHFKKLKTLALIKDNPCLLFMYKQAHHILQSLYEKHAFHFSFTPHPYGFSPEIIQLCKTYKQLDSLENSKENLVTVSAEPATAHYEEENTNEEIEINDGELPLFDDWLSSLDEPVSSDLQGTHSFLTQESAKTSGGISDEKSEKNSVDDLEKLIGEFWDVDNENQKDNTSAPLNPNEQGKDTSTVDDMLREMIYGPDFSTMFGTTSSADECQTVHNPSISAQVLTESTCMKNQGGINLPESMPSLYSSAISNDCKPGTSREMSLILHQQQRSTLTNNKSLIEIESDKCESNHDSSALFKNDVKPGKSQLEEMTTELLPVPKPMSLLPKNYKSDREKDKADINKVAQKCEEQSKSAKTTRNRKYTKKEPFVCPPELLALQKAAHEAVKEKYGMDEVYKRPTKSQYMKMKVKTGALVFPLMKLEEQGKLEQVEGIRFVEKHFEKTSTVLVERVKGLKIEDTSSPDQPPSCVNMTDEKHDIKINSFPESVVGEKEKQGGINIKPPSPAATETSPSTSVPALKLKSQTTREIAAEKSGNSSLNILTRRESSRRPVSLQHERGKHVLDFLSNVKKPKPVREFLNSFEDFDRMYYNPQFLNKYHEQLIEAVTKTPEPNDDLAVYNEHLSYLKNYRKKLKRLKTTKKKEKDMKLNIPAEVITLDKAPEVITPEDSPTLEVPTDVITKDLPPEEPVSFHNYSMPNLDELMEMM